MTAIALDTNARVWPILIGNVLCLQYERHGADRIERYGSAETE